MTEKENITVKKRKKKRRLSEITQLKRLILRLVKKFEQDIAHPGNFSNFWGEKESPATVITKLSQILLKLFVIADPKRSGKRIKEEITEEDFALLKYCFENRKLEKSELEKADAEKAESDADISAVP